MTPNYEQALYLLAEADNLIVKLMSQLAGEHPPANANNDPNFPDVLGLILEGTAWCEAIRMVSNEPPIINEEQIMEALITAMLLDAFK